MVIAEYAVKKKPKYIKTKLKKVQLKHFNMTPKDKTEQLVHKYYLAIPSDEMGLSDEASRLCALIAVDEILFALKYDMNEPTSASIRYWKQVKQEIEKL